MANLLNKLAHASVIAAALVTMTTGDRWEVFVRTSNIPGADADADTLYLEIYGSEGASGPLPLDVPGHDDLEQGHTDRFTFNTSDVGEVDHIRVWLDGTDGWHGEDILLYDMTSHAEYMFIVNRWIDDKYDSSYATLYPARSNSTQIGKRLSTL